ncbi:hypothetical protein EUGRSUZ_L02020 [Eucalyptus grandis]|uniref:Leucine-rich repeat-containing N-terminal plant-type domain-containing protein n=1 Tax=Eucalyptus grandis TaxID=71139 RepID=A0A058ZRS8_EUCGR|nr:hypothetical protein EUGRSUZ_L02020 [Eucalyptus grandis]
MKKEALWVFVVVWGITCLCGSRGCREQERVALLALNATLDLTYRGDTGGSYFNCCSWKGVECNPTTGRITQLMLFNSRYGHFGPKTWYLNASLLLPFEELKSLQLSSNYLGGWIAPKGGFSNLMELDISENAVHVVAIAEGIKNLSHLENLYLDGVHLKDVGTVMRALGALSSLKILSLQYNTIEGTIATQDFHNFSKLEQLILDYSSLNTTMGILSSLGPLTSLRFLSSYSTGLSGKLSYQTWLLENNTKLENLLMANNLFATLEVPLITPCNLSMMDMSNNDIRGELTTEFCLNVPNLYHLNLSANKLEGNIPSELGSIKSLSILDLSHNNFSGELPIQLLDSNSSLYKLNVAYNNLQGEIVFSGNTMNLIWLCLQHNMFTGDLSFLSSLVNPLLLDVSNNFFIGKLPKLIANMSSFMLLDLSKNQLSGLIMQELFNLPRLEYLALSDNNLSGSLALSFIAPELRHIHLNGNKLNGSIVHLLPNRSNLVTLDLSENEFFGSIPYWLGNLSQLSILLLRGNSFYGTFPMQLCRLKSLSMMDLSENNLFGPLPICLGPMNFSSKGYADKVDSAPHFEYANQVSSPCSYVRTIRRWIYDTQFYHNKILLDEGWEVQHIVGFTTKRRFDAYKGYALLNMIGLDFSYNHFSGEIPPEIAISQDMLMLNLSHNNLTGHIPMSLSNLTKIESIDLSYNNLIGSIPEELTQLISLEVFNVSYNNLSRAIPNKNQFGSFIESSYYGNHLLCGLPLSNDCSTTNNINCSATKSCTKAKEDGFIDGETFYISFGVSYTMVLLVIPVVLFINPQWRQGWFHYVGLVITTCRSLFITCYYFVEDGFQKLSSGPTI